MARTLADIIDVPLVISDATSLTQAGFQFFLKYHLILSLHFIIIFTFLPFFIIHKTPSKIF